eukprot:1195641-Alexandrium_andersonii.AAC.1
MRVPLRTCSPGGPALKKPLFAMPETGMLVQSEGCEGISRFRDFGPRRSSCIVRICISIVTMCIIVPSGAA